MQLRDFLKIPCTEPKIILSENTCECVFDDDPDEWEIALDMCVKRLSIVYEAGLPNLCVVIGEEV